ncbi:MAG: DUF2007 domain-containing protein [Bacteroidales bacterium]|nr:DUF2007 domain-containing protein [Bacteroidales bacterium]
MKTVEKYNNSFSANIAKGVLAEAGIEAFILNENLIFTTGAVNTDLISIELVVEDSQYEQAVKILQAKPIE